MHTAFPNACIAFSETLYIGRGDRESVQNTQIKELNSHMMRFTRNNNYIYITHSTLQATRCRLFDDDVHINAEGGTAVFVSDIYKATGWHSQRHDVNTDTDGERVYYNRSYRQRDGRQQDVRSRDRAGRPDVRPRQRKGQRNFTRRDDDDVDMESMIRILTLNMLSKYQAK